MQQIPRLQCRGEDKRRQICKDYRIIPKAHFRILNGVSIHSDAGDTMTEEYFIFDAVDKNDSSRIYNIYCGAFVAKSFAKLAGITLPPIYNPLRSVSHSSSNERGNNRSTDNQYSHKWNDERKQLYDIVMITMMYLGEIRTDLPLFDIKQKLESNVSYPPFDSYIQAVNTILGNLNLKFTHILDILRSKNIMKEFEYDLILKRIENNPKIKQQNITD